MTVGRPVRATACRGRADAFRVCLPIEFREGNKSGIAFRRTGSESANYCTDNFSREQARKRQPTGRQRERSDDSKPDTFTRAVGSIFLLCTTPVNCTPASGRRLAGDVRA